ncbi:hypothetical protein F5Y17DRAFT_218515 [Xylariaceae sp. FL0594]|nr:hypothetical protein F5Y17DRAFT_218515 [Xylariaceae sp. FL0594]
MGAKDSEVDLAAAPSELRDERQKERRSKSVRSSRSDKEKEREKLSRDGLRHHKSHRSSKSKLADGDSSLTSSSSQRRHRTREEKERDREKKAASTTDLVPELSRSSLAGSRVSLPYPSFSKAHSKEAVHSRDDLSATHRQGDPLTPDPTDLSAADMRRSASAGGSKERHRSSRKDDRPPSPPETELSGEKKRRSKASSPRLRSDDSERPNSRTSGISRSHSRHDDKSKLSMRSKTSSQATYIKSPSYPPPPPPFIQVVDDNVSAMSDAQAAGAESAAAPIAPHRSASTKSTHMPSLDADDSPESVQDSSPKTPTATARFPPPQVYPNEHHTYYEKERPTPTATPAHDFGPPPPPPPPPPPLEIRDVPRVDYLLQHGGLPHPVPKQFLSVVPRQNGTRPSHPPLTGCDTVFAPFFDLLGQYQTVLQKQGSIAVATGHKSVARRLLDRLEDVFSRDLPMEGCTCIMCEKSPEEHRGLGWGEVLERVGGRVEMPSWPPFDLSTVVATAIESTADLPPRPASPVKLDPDIAEEFREHYMRQSKKVRSSVDKWMNSCAETPAPPPSEIDEETLAFAMLTSLDQEERPYFSALMSGAKEIQPVLRAPTPMRKSRTDFLVKTGLQLQRLYRLTQAPRDAETALYLVKNPLHHDLLATMIDISPQEWEILISGRFDGFLWSGADVDDAVTPTAETPLSRGATPASGFFSPPPSRGPMTPGMRQTPGYGNSRSTTPYSGMYSRGTTPASFVSLSSTTTQGQNRQPVSYDEEVEMAVLAEVEREIYQGMEALEDAFEKLHERAEVVRNALRQRNNGLLMNLQHRRSGRIDVLPQHSGGSVGYERPAWARGDDDGGSESDWGGEDIDLAPEDSASNISSSRHRRPKRRHERRTPAPIEEDEEEI